MARVTKTLSEKIVLRSVAVIRIGCQQMKRIAIVFDAAPLHEPRYEFHAGAGIGYVLIEQNLQG